LESAAAACVGSAAGSGHARVTTAVGVMARAPSSGGKSRLARHLTHLRLIELRSALLSDTLHAIANVPDVTIFFTPDDAAAEIAALCGDALVCVPQEGGDLGARMLAALRCLTPSDTAAAILVGSDIPMLTADHLGEAADTLQHHGGIVVGPADDGGYYLIGMTQPHAGLFEGIAWGSASVLADTVRAAAGLGLETRMMRSAYDVDTIEDLRRLQHDLTSAPADVCPHLRRWFSEG
jgi:rSAM/selenodomain-associated transferase 1